MYLFRNNIPDILLTQDMSVHNGRPKGNNEYVYRKKEFGEWEIPPWEVTIDYSKMVGEGTFCRVYLAEWRKTIVVAKVLKNSFDMHAKELILKEFENMTKMHHPNIVQLFGYIEEPFTIIMEYFKNGDLYKNLTKLSYTKKLKVATDIIKGLIYLHQRNPTSLIHRDIKLRNVLLTDSYTAKIADFGLSTFSLVNIIKQTSKNNLVELANIQEERIGLLSNHLENNNVNISYHPDLDCNNKDLDYGNKDLDYGNKDLDCNNKDLTAEVGTERYMAPEVKTSNYNCKVDIYSAGILFYELFTSRIYNKKFHWTRINKKLKMLIQDMCELNQEDRPSALECFELLHALDSKKLTFPNVVTF